MFISRVYILGHPGTKPGCLGHTRVSISVPPEYTVVVGTTTWVPVLLWPFLWKPSILVDGSSRAAGSAWVINIICLFNQATNQLNCNRTFNPNPLPTPNLAMVGDMPTPWLKNACNEHYCVLRQHQSFKVLDYVRPPAPAGGPCPGYTPR